MRIKFSLSFFLTIAVVIVAFTGCDVSGEQHYDFKAGNSLKIVGSADVILPQDTTTADTTDVTQAIESYYSRAFTIKKSYTWSLSGGEGARKDSVYRQGEYIHVTFIKPGTYTIKVDDSEYQGSLKVTASRQPNSDL